jgi:hypothetical protein
MSHKIAHYSLDFPSERSVCGGERSHHDAAGMINRISEA